uniref:Uncharacterized protein n=1 Tax=Rhizophora mucronata TaxID=61149 RepID=A0A2P2QME5_RHIMU
MHGILFQSQKLKREVGSWTGPCAIKNYKNAGNSALQEKQRMCVEGTSSKGKSLCAELIPIQLYVWY